MFAMQYKIRLPEDYDMKMIRQRVKQNGEKTDGFPDLFFKAYLIRIKAEPSNMENEYSPFYLWKDSGGMNTFIWEGFYDHILASFGRQKINISIPYLFELKENFASSQYVAVFEKIIPVSSHMQPLTFSMKSEACTGRILLYDPNQWKAREFYFFAENLNQNQVLGMEVYEVLHISMG